MPPHEIHACHPSRKGVSPAVRAFVEFVAKEIDDRLSRLWFEQLRQPPLKRSRHRCRPSNAQNTP